VKSAGHAWDGPASMSADMPTFAQDTLGRVPKLVRATDGHAAAGFEGEIQKPSGPVSNVSSDVAGQLPAVDADQFERLAVRFIKKNI